MGMGTQKRHRLCSNSRDSGKSPLAYPSGVNWITGVEANFPPHAQVLRTFLPTYLGAARTCHMGLLELMGS